MYVCMHGRMGSTEVDWGVLHVCMYMYVCTVPISVSMSLSGVLDWGGGDWIGEGG